MLNFMMGTLDEPAGSCGGGWICQTIFKKVTNDFCCFVIFKGSVDPASAWIGGEMEGFELANI